LWDLCVGFAYPTLGLGSNELSCCCGSWNCRTGSSCWETCQRD
jgi:hypothetical protein